MAEELRLALFGNVEVRRAGVPVTGFSSSKAQALLCYLAVTGRPHLRPTLAGLLWGEMPEASAQNNLRKALTNLRQLVGPYLSITRQAVAFNRDSPYWLDVEVFEAQVGGASAETDIERLQEAVELYRGDFLEGFYVRQALAFEEWVLAQRARLRELALQALHTLAVHHTRRGEAGHAAGIDYTTRLLALEPWREEAHRQLMLLLAQSGQRSAALAQYETCCQVLAEELGVEPGPETTALYERIRAGKLSRLRPEPAPPVLPSFLSATPSHPSIAAPFVARERELEQLDGFLDLALAGQGRVVFVTGEAGTGKTALIQEFSRRAQERHANLVAASGNCNAYTGVGDPYLPFREILCLLTGDVESRWAAGAISLEQARRLWNLIPHAVQLLVETGPDLIDIFIPGPILAARAATAAPGGARWLDQLEELVASKEPGRGRANLQQTDLFEQYAMLLTALARQHPLLLVVDDLQWADAGSISLLFHLGRRLEGSHILVVGIYRPAEVALGRDGERHPLEPVVNEFQRHFGQIQVDLRQTEDRQFVEAFLDTEPNRLGAKFRQALYQRTKGHALFTVEMLRGMQERRDLVQDEAGRWVEGPAVDWESLPVRVEGVIGERINRLPVTLQETLKVASAEGEDFTAEVVAQVRAAGELEIVGQLSSELDKRHRLVRSQSSQRLDPGGQRLSQYRFQHILFQKYMYDSLDEAERAYLHEAVGNALEQLYEGQTEAVAIQLARHFQAAGLLAKALGYLRQAGERAVRLSANEEAITHFTQALALLRNLPDTPERAQQELNVRIALGVALLVTKGYAASEVGTTYSRARELLQRVGETLQLFPVLEGLCQLHLNRGELRRAHKLGERLLRMAQRQQDPKVLVPGHFVVGGTLWFLGEFGPAQAHFEQGLSLYKPQHYRPLVSPYRQDPGFAGLAYVVLLLWLFGYPDQARARSRELLTLALELSHPYSLAHTLFHIAAFHHLLGEEQAVLERAEAAITLSTEQEFATWLAWGMILRGWALAVQGQEETGIAQMEQGAAAWWATGAKLARPLYLYLLADVHGKGGRAEEGLGHLDEALAAAHETEERWWEAELYRLKGELLLTRSEGVAAAEAEACFHQAIEVARRQSAKSLELRAVMSLSRLWQRQGKQAEARQILAEIYDWFTEGFDTADLQEAKALLEELSRN